MLRDLLLLGLGNMTHGLEGPALLLEAVSFLWGLGKALLPKWEASAATIPQGVVLASVGSPWWRPL